MTATVIAIHKNETAIRRYVQSEIPHIVNMAVTEIPKLPHYQTSKVEPARIEFLLRTNLNDESAFMTRVLVNEDNIIVGGIAAYCVTQLISWDKTTGDIFLFIDPQYRSIKNAVSLIRTYVDWAKQRGAKEINATHTAGYRSAEMDVLLKKYCGFEVIGTLYRYTGAKS